MDFTLTEFEGELLDLGRTYAEREIAAVAARAWHEERCPTEVLRGLGELGLLGTAGAGEVGRDRLLHGRLRGAARGPGDGGPVGRDGLAGALHHRQPPAAAVR